MAQIQYVEQTNILRGRKKTLLKLYRLQSWSEKLKMKGHGGLQEFNLDNPGIKKFFAWLWKTQVKVGI